MNAKGAIPPLRYRLCELEWQSAADARPSIALLPAGGEVWEDFLDTIGVTLDQFCAEGPGGWLRGYAEALACTDFRTVLILFSARVAVPRRYVEDVGGNVVLVLPVPRWYALARHRAPTYRDVLTGNWTRHGQSRSALLLGSVLSHLSTPLAMLARALRAEGCRALICQEYEYFRLDAALLLGRLLRLPVFATFQGSGVDPNLLSRAVKRHVLRRTAGLLVAPREEMERVGRSYGDAVPLFQIFNPVDTEAWQPGGREAARTALGAGPHTRIAVWHGRIALRAKGLDVLLNAWERLRAERPGADFRLLLLGTGEDAEAFGQHIARLGDARVSWTNNYVTDRAMIQRFLVAGDVYAFPSRHEGFAVAPLEAMACGLPVVAADASGVPDILANGAEDGGIIVPRGDVAALAEALGRLLDNPALSTQLGARARRRIETTFSPKAVGRQLHMVFTDAGIPMPMLRAIT